MDKLNDTIDACIRIARVPLIVTSLLANSAILIVLLRYRSLRWNSSNMLIAQLAFADLITGFGLFIRGVQNEIYRALGITLFRRGTCMLYGATTILGMTLLQFTIIMITFDRLCVLAFPFFYRRHVDNARLSIARFVLHLILSMISFFGQFIDLRFNTNVAICSSGATWTDGYRLYFMLFCIIASFTTIVLNVVTMVIYWHKIRLSSERQEHYVIISQTAITISYILFWCCPSMVYLVAIILNIQSVVFGTITLILSIGAACFASLNPFLFLWKHTEFRGYFIRFYNLRNSVHHSPHFLNAVSNAPSERHHVPKITHC